MSRKLKILQINKFHFLKGGSERHVFDLSKKLRDAGHEVLHFSMEDNRNSIGTREEKRYFIDRIDFNKFSIKNIIKLFYNYDAVKKLKKIIKEEKPDIVHLHNFAHHFSPVILSVIKKSKIPIIQTLHDYKLICPNYKLFSCGEICTKCKGGKYYNCFSRKCMKDSYLKSLLASLEAYYVKFFKFYNNIDFFIAPSRYMKEKMIEFGFSEDKIDVMYNFVNIQSTIESVASQEKYLLYFGRLANEKGVDFLVESMLEVKNEKLNLKIVGFGPIYSKLKEKIEGLGLNERVKLLGYKSGSELEGLIDSAEAVVMPSLWPENMPYSLLEAMSRGKVVIVSRVGGMAELIDGKNGMTFERDSIASLLGKIKSLDSIDNNQMGKLARERVSKLTSENYLEKLLGAYYTLVN